MKRKHIQRSVVWLVGLILLLVACASPAPQPTPVAVQPTGTATPTETVQPTGTATATPDLAAIWQQANQDGAEATALLYFGQNSESAPPLALWRMSLDGSGQPKKVADGLQGDFDVSAARLSADEQWIAYTTPMSDWPNELRVMRVDGSDNQMLIQTGNVSDCRPEFAWSHTGATLIYRHHGGVIIRSYDAPTGLTREVSGPGSSIFLGLDNQGRALMTPYPDDDQPRTIVAVDLGTQEHTTLGTMPSAERLYCRKLSPDGNHLLFNLHRTTYHFDGATRQFMPLDVVALHHALWSSGSNALLTFSRDAEVAVVPLTDTAGITALSIELKPPSGPPWISGALNTSPDGQWLVGCFGYATNQHAWLYHLPTQTWQQLAHGCIEVVGWPTR